MWQTIRRREGHAAVAHAAPTKDDDGAKKDARNADGAEVKTIDLIKLT